jgi:RNA polymerase sigma-70 factor (ECF subfamily)
MSHEAERELAVRCAAGDPEALAELERTYFPGIRRALAKMGLSRESIDEVMQALRADMFVVRSAHPAHPPRIAEYEGRGSLAAWLRVSATRLATKLVRPRNDVAADEDALLAARAPGDDPELSFIKEASRSAFKAAFQKALDALDDRGRALLKMHLIDGLGIDAIAEVYDVHRATAARWLARAEEEILESTRKSLMLDGKIGREECASILRLVRSQLGDTIRRRLAAT